jgi:hypothetical protein
VLTGTPLENRLEELVSIVDFAEPFVEEVPGVPSSDGPGVGDNARPLASDGGTGAPDDGPLASLLRTGFQLVEQFLTAAQAQEDGRTSEGKGAGARPFETVRDERTGERYLKIRMPAPDVVDRVAQSLRTLLASLHR